MRKSRFCILATVGQTDGQMDSPDALSRSRSRERRLNDDDDDDDDDDHSRPMSDVSSYKF